MPTAFARHWRLNLCARRVEDHRLNLEQLSGPAAKAEVVREELHCFARGDVEGPCPHDRSRSGRAAALGAAPSAACDDTLHLEPLAACTPPIAILTEGLCVRVAKELGGRPGAVRRRVQHQICHWPTTLVEQSEEAR